MKRIFTVLAAALVLAGVADARNVKGKVTCEGQILQGVIVSDGTNFAITGKKGTYKLKVSEDAPFVFVITPAGTTVDYSTGTPVFFKELTSAKSYDFELVKTSDSKDFTILPVSDPQMKTQKHFEKFSGKPLADLKAMASKCSAERTTVGLSLGDIGWDSISLINPLYKSAMQQLCVPFYPVIGNHDFNRDKQGRDSRRDYEADFGPVNYAFFLGSDLVIVLKNIIYDTNKKFKEGYTSEELDFVKNLIALVPEDMHIFIAQHAPLYRWFKHNDLVAGEDMLEILKGRHVDFICGHTHISNHLVYSDNIVEHNPASICGTWWDTKWCNDGTPRGYPVYTKVNGELSWYYHPLDFDDDFQVCIIKPGASKWHPNSVLANVWDYDQHWTVEWYQDGQYMGAMTETRDVDPCYIKEINAKFEGKEIPEYKRPRHNIHYFEAQPSQYAQTVTVVVTSRFGKTWSYDVDLTDYIDVQGHRGGAGLMPEDTQASMKNAMDLGCNTLELDLQVSSDSLVVVSHDNYFHPRCSTRPDGSLIEASDPKEYLFTMPYDSIAKYDVGLRANEIWPDKKLVAQKKPLLSELLDFCESYARDNALSLPRYNIEIKCSAKKGEGTNWPDYKSFVDLCVAEMAKWDLGDRLVVQCFDVRALNYMHEKYPDLYLSYLTDKKSPDYDKFMSLLNFKPEWISPEHSVVTAEMVQKCHAEGIKIVPWTPDKPEDLQRLVDLGCDAIITNYPDRLIQITRGY